ncbi:unnamed protein product [Gemmata massiliana]|uniref:Carboxypeptidase regulatory-like domain-containing protein n=1 Tax=Gemmata massiliana TaxID=1210884 RepID=A0A6P2DJK6_9BACT|nr:hypothetical protein [Gemmata massiliana]VTS01825.1 unnamed protein product [Gemmata massiliana]
MRTHGTRGSVPLAIGLLALAHVAGCGPGAGAEVSGTVTFQGTPIRAGKVTFYHPDRPGRNVIADIRPDGTYRVYACPSGEVKVTVQPLPPAAKSTSRGQPYTGAKKAAPVPPVNAKYGDPATTDLVCRVTGAAQTFDIDLGP